MLTDQIHFFNTVPDSSTASQQITFQNTYFITSKNERSPCFCTLGKHHVCIDLCLWLSIWLSLPLWQICRQARWYGAFQNGMSFQDVLTKNTYDEESIHTFSMIRWEFWLIPFNVYFWVFYVSVGVLFVCDVISNSIYIKLLSNITCKYHPKIRL